MTQPSAISYGMTDDEFWRGRPWLFAAYREARRRETEERAWERWQFGAYVYDAIQRNTGLLNPLVKRHSSEPWPDVPYGMEEPGATVAVDPGGRPVATDEHHTAKVDRTHALIIDGILGHNRKQG